MNDVDVTTEATEPLNQTLGDVDDVKQSSSNQTDATDDAILDGQVPAPYVASPGGMNEDTITKSGDFQETTTPAVTMLTFTTTTGVDTTDTLAASSTQSSIETTYNRLTESSTKAAQGPATLPPVQGHNNVTNTSVDDIILRPHDVSSTSQQFITSTPLSSPPTPAETVSSHIDKETVISTVFDKTAAAPPVTVPNAGGDSTVLPSTTHAPHVVHSSSSSSTTNTTALISSEHISSHAPAASTTTVSSLVLEQNGSNNGKLVFAAGSLAVLVVALVFALCYCRRRKRRSRSRYVHVHRVLVVTICKHSAYVY